MDDKKNNKKKVTSEYLQITKKKGLPSINLGCGRWSLPRFKSSKLPKLSAAVLCSPGGMYATT